MGLSVGGDNERLRKYAYSMVFTSVGVQGSGKINLVGVLLSLIFPVRGRLYTSITYYNT